MVGPEIKRGWQRTANISRKGCSLHVYRRGRWGLLLSNQNHSLVYAYCTFWLVGGTSRLWFEACCLLSSIFNLQSPSSPPRECSGPTSCAPPSNPYHIPPKTCKFPGYQTHSHIYYLISDMGCPPLNIHYPHALAFSIFYFYRF